jgi:type I restriction enzyme R subunit
MQQALDLRRNARLPFAYSSNGDAFLEHDRTGWREPRGTGDPPRPVPSSPDELWQRYCAVEGLTREQQVVAHDYYDDGSGKRAPLLPAVIAINRTVEAIARARTASCSSWPPAPARPTPPSRSSGGCGNQAPRKRILFLADRNILADQTKTNDFKPFGQAMTKITNRTVDKSYEIYLCALSGRHRHRGEKNIYKQFSPDFFDLIVVDECHRGSAAADAAWREILEYFSSATQIGSPPRPRRPRCLQHRLLRRARSTPTRSSRASTTASSPPTRSSASASTRTSTAGGPKGKLDKYGHEIEDRDLQPEGHGPQPRAGQRTERVAEKVTEYLRATDRYAKTIVFCEDIDHAERMRQALVNANPDLAAQNQVRHAHHRRQRRGQGELDNFIDPESTTPSSPPPRSSCPPASTPRPAS